MASGVATEEGRILGTPGYMSPEQVRGKTVDKQTDIWSFGCVLYELLPNPNQIQGQSGSRVTLRRISGNEGHTHVGGFSE